jgi:hypothetical protein
VFKSSSVLRRTKIKESQTDFSHKFLYIQTLQSVQTHQVLNNKSFSIRTLSVNEDISLNFLHLLILVHPEKLAQEGIRKKVHFSHFSFILGHLNVRRFKSLIFIFFLIYFFITQITSSIISSKNVSIFL